MSTAGVNGSPVSRGGEPACWQRGQHAGVEPGGPRRRQPVVEHRRRRRATTPCQHERRALQARLVRVADSVSGASVSRSPTRVPPAGRGEHRAALVRRAGVRGPVQVDHQVGDGGRRQQGLVPAGRAARPPLPASRAGVADLGVERRHVDVGEVAGGLPDPGRAARGRATWRSARPCRAAGRAGSAARPWCRASVVRHLVHRRSRRAPAARPRPRANASPSAGRTPGRTPPARSRRPGRPSRAGPAPAPASTSGAASSAGARRRRPRRRPRSTSATSWSGPTPLPGQRPRRRCRRAPVRRPGDGHRTARCVTPLVVSVLPPSAGCRRCPRSTITAHPQPVGRGQRRRSRRARSGDGPSGAHRPASCAC